MESIIPVSPGAHPLTKKPEDSGYEIEMKGKRETKKIFNKSFTSEGLVRIAKNCDLGLEKTALGLRPATWGFIMFKTWEVRIAQKCDRVGKSHIFTTPTPLLVKTSLLMC